MINVPELILAGNHPIGEAVLFYFLSAIREP